MRKAIVFLTLAALLNALSAAESNGQLVVRVLSTREISSLTVTPLSSSDSIRVCRSCRTESIGTAFRATTQGNDIVLSNGRSAHAFELIGRFRIKAANDEVTAAGVWNLSEQHGKLRLLLSVDTEHYVTLALNGEAAPNEPLESLKAMAVAERTYALENAGRHSYEGFNLCDSTHCQALRFGKISSQVQAAVLDTAGETLWYHGRRATVFYTQNCGGSSEAARDMWPELQAPYLVVHRDPYCERHASSQWHAEIPATEVRDVFQKEGWTAPAHIEAVRILKRTASGRVAQLEFAGDGLRVPVSASSFRFAADRRLGWNLLRSDSYDINFTGGVLRFDGHGYGHGVGLCQAGAFEMAAEDHSYREILDFYFPGTSVGIAPSDHGWQQLSGSGWTLRTATGSATLINSGNVAWTRAQTLFRPRTPLQPMVQQFPSTELFRESANEPGWMLASTQGSEIFLQPESVLNRNGNEGNTLLHEFLHTLIEGEASPQTPLWLREGLVEALASDSVRAAAESHVALQDLDPALAHPTSEDESQRAHAAAARLTRALLARYGLEQVRQWMRSGSVPDTALSALTELP
jgi:stage II sporulation protein D